MAIETPVVVNPRPWVKTTDVTAGERNQKPAPPVGTELFRNVTRPVSASASAAIVGCSNELPSKVDSWRAEGSTLPPLAARVALKAAAGAPLLMADAMGVAKFAGVPASRLLLASSGTLDTAARSAEWMGKAAARGRSERFARPAAAAAPGAVKATIGVIRNPATNAPSIARKSVPVTCKFEHRPEARIPTANANLFGAFFNKSANWNWQPSMVRRTQLTGRTPIETTRILTIDCTSGGRDARGRPAKDPLGVAKGAIGTRKSRPLNAVSDTLSITTMPSIN